MTSINGLGRYIDANVTILRRKISQGVVVGRAFNLKWFLHYHVVDAIGDLAFSKSFDLQLTNNTSRAGKGPQHRAIPVSNNCFPHFSNNSPLSVRLVVEQGF